jgi:hypothetical protein
MALSQAVEAALTSAKMTDEYRKIMRDVLEANPDLQGGWLRQSDYDRSMNALKSDKARNDQWFKDSNEKYVQMETQVASLAAEKSDLEFKIQSGHYSPEQENLLLKELKTVKDTLSGLDGRFVGTETLQDTLRTEAQGVVSFLSASIFDIVDIAEEYRNEFGKSFTKEDRQGLIDYCEGENKKGNPVNLQQAYKMKYAADIDKHKEDRIRQEVIKEERTRNNMPISGEPAPIGHLQMKFQGKTSDNLPVDASMDAVQAAAAASLRAEGKI